MIPSACAYQKLDDGTVIPLIETANGLEPCAWAAQSGSQSTFLSLSDLIVLYAGTRGNGKTLALLLDFLQFVGAGWGPDHRGLYLRQNSPHLRDAIKLSHTWFPKLVPGASWNKMDSTWTFPGGESIWLTHIENAKDTDRLQGQQFDFCALDELTLWHDAIDILKFCLSIVRTTNPKVQLHVRCATNPYGVAREAVMDYFRLPLKPGVVIGPLIDDSYDDEGHLEPARRTVHGHLGENPFLDRGYLARLYGTGGDPSRIKAWTTGTWTEPSSSMFGDIFASRSGSIYIKPFKIPTPEKIRLSFDHGSAAPAAGCFWWKSDGSDIEFEDGTTMPTNRGDIFLLGEVYLARKAKGLNLSIGEIAARLKAYCIKRNWPLSILKKEANVADSAIFAEDGRPSIAADYLANGIRFSPANKRPGSRAMGAALLREWLSNTRSDDERERLRPGLFVVEEHCPEFVRQIPHIQRDEKDPDVWAENQPDHLLDAVCYWLLAEPEFVMRSGRIDERGFHPYGPNGLIR